MPRQTFTTIENSFVNGLVTQASGLNFPEKACTDTDNCVFDEVGRVTRRLGIDFEDNHVFTNIVKDTNAITNYLWENVSSDADVSFLVVQVGKELLFYNLSSADNFSQGLNSQRIDISNFAASPAVNVSTKECQFANGHGVLFVYHELADPFFVEYDIVSDTFTSTEITLEIRDFEGVEDDLEIDEEPSTLSNAHKYNLQNQGWDKMVDFPFDHAQFFVGQNIVWEIWQILYGVYPANNNIWWIWKNADDQFNPQIQKIPEGGTVPESVPGSKKSIDFGNTPAPKGHYLLNVFRKDRSDVSGIPSIPTVSSGIQRTSCGAFFAGRVWYSGIKHQKFKGHVYFSQIIESQDQFGKCYQTNDPTAENKFDLLQSDGGFIDIADAGNIIKLMPVQSSLVVFATNGIWEITGSEGLGFRATDFVVRKIADIDSLSSSSFVDVAGYPIWWNVDGIYVLEPGQVGGLTPKNISDKSIKQFFQNINKRSKQFAKGAFNTLSKTVQWIYRDVEGGQGGVQHKYNCNRCLTLNLNTGAFFPWSISLTGPKLNGIFFKDSNFQVLSNVNVTNLLGEIVTATSGENVSVFGTSEEAFTSVPFFSYIAAVDDVNIINSQITFAAPFSPNYLDWESNINTSNFDSFFVTGYKLHGEAIRKFQSNYINLFTDNVGLGQFFIRGIWDYTKDVKTGRWSTKQHIIDALENLYEVRKRRIKIRGNGTALQFRVDNVENKPFSIIGWSMFESRNQWV